MKVDLILSTLGVGNEHTCLDFGGSLGLFSRMMRDRGYNFFRSDPYSRNFYVPFHDAEEHELKSASVITAFEVFEHLPSPKLDLDRFLTFSPDVFIASTEVYQDQAADWWYYACHTGQHVFFYSHFALLAIAECYGMHLISDGKLHLFCRRSPQSCAYGPREILKLAQFFQDDQAFYREALALFNSGLANPYKWTGKDYTYILEQIRKKQDSAAA